MNFTSAIAPALHLGGRLSGYCAALLLAAGLAAQPAYAAHDTAPGAYTESQASAGRRVYNQHCSQCHGSQLQGQAGPPLAGKPFASDLSYSKISAQQLFDFIKQHMPKNAPGSLTDRQYRRVFAYILAQNGYPKGAKPLTDKSVGSVDLLPYPGGAKNSAQNNSSH